MALVRLFAIPLLLLPATSLAAEEPCPEQAPNSECDRECEPAGEAASGAGASSSEGPTGPSASVPQDPWRLGENLPPANSDLLIPARQGAGSLAGEAGLVSTAASRSATGFGIVMSALAFVLVLLIRGRRAPVSEPTDV